jgi:hypothetical protein
MPDIDQETRNGILKAYPDGYFCTECEQLHKPGSAIYFNHWEYASISLMIKKAYHCTKCNRPHRSGSKIFDDHYEFMGEHL